MEVDLQHVYDSLDGLADRLCEVERNLNLLASYSAKQWVGKFVTVPAYVVNTNKFDGDGPYRSIVDSVKGTTLTIGNYTNHPATVDFFTILEEELQ